MTHETPFHAQTEGIADTTLHNTGALAKDKDVTSLTLSRAGRLLKPFTRLSEIMYQNTGMYYSYYSMYRGSDQSLLQPEHSCGCFSFQIFVSKRWVLIVSLVFHSCTEVICPCMYCVPQRIWFMWRAYFLPEQIGHIALWDFSTGFCLSQKLKSLSLLGKSTSLQASLIGGNSQLD